MDRSVVVTVLLSIAVLYELSAMASDASSSDEVMSSPEIAMTSRF